jgi:hypothetical protein
MSFSVEDTLRKGDRQNISNQQKLINELTLGLQEDIRNKQIKDTIENGINVLINK